MQALLAALALPQFGLTTVFVIATISATLTFASLATLSWSGWLRIVMSRACSVAGGST